MPKRESDSQSDVGEIFRKISQLGFVLELEKLFELPEGFYARLLGEDDWSFVIKLHALFEAEATHMLFEELGKPELSDLISRIELSGQSFGKLAFFKALDLLSSEERRFIQTLSEVRNSFVHDITNVDRSLLAYRDALPDSEQKKLKTAFGWGPLSSESSMDSDAEGNVKLDDILKHFSAVSYELNAIKMSLWIGALVVLRKMHFAAGSAAFKSKMREIDKQLGEAVLKLFPDKAQA